MVAFLAYFMGGGNSKQYNLQISAFPVPSCIIHLADAAAIKVRLRYVCQMYVLLTLLRRRSQRIVPGSPSSYFDMRCCLFLEQTLWLRKERSGRSTERFPLRHSQRYCPEFCSSLDAEYDCQKNNKLVWDESIRIMTDLFDNVWGDKIQVVVDHCLDVTLPVRSLWFVSQTLLMSQRLHQIALFVISVAGGLYPIPVLIVS